MVGIYRTPEALEAAWKYFILGASESRSPSSAPFSSIWRRGRLSAVVFPPMAWTILIRRVAEFDPSLLNVAFIFLLLGLRGRKSALFRLHAWLPDAHAEGPTPISAVLSGLLLERRALRGAAFQDAAGPRTHTLSRRVR